MPRENVSSSANMLGQFSPGMRKFLAIAVLILGLFLIWTLLLSPVIAQMEASLTKLQDARFQRIRLERIDARAIPQKAQPITAGILVTAKTREEATTQIGAYLNNLAVQNGLQVANITPRPGTGGSKLIAFDFALTGEEISVMRFINNLERGSPAMRLRSWRIESPELMIPPDRADEDIPLDPSIQFSGQAVAAWIKP